MIKIEKGVPVPPHKRVNNKTYALMEAMRAMEVGDSFALANMRQSVVTSCAKRLGLHMTTRSVYGPDGKKTGIRVWRQEKPGRGSRC
jgi:hypothetical protein